MNASGCAVGGLMRALLAATPAPPPAGDLPADDLLEAGRRVMMSRQALIDGAGNLAPHVAETHAECAALARRLRELEEEWRAALGEARKGIASQLRSARQLQRFAAAR